MSAAETFAPLIGDVASRLLGQADHSDRKGETLRWGTHGSLKIDADNGTWFDHEAKEGGGTLDLIVKIRGGDRPGAVDWLKEQGLIEDEDKAFYDYQDAKGQTLYRVERRGTGPGRQFLHHGPDGLGGFVCQKGCMRGVERVPYRLPALVAAKPETIIFVCEGEKDADRLASNGLVATCNSGGAGKFMREFVHHFQGRRVVLLEDNDKAGRDHVRDVLRKLGRHPAQIAILALPGLPDKGDVSDWLNSGKTIDELKELAEKALESTHSGESSSAPPSQSLAFRKGVSARALMSKTFDPIRWIVPGYLTEGMYVLAGAPKQGKSWLALNWMIAIGNGGKAMGSIDCEGGDVLGLMLEDNERRLQRRLRQMRLMDLPERVTLLTEWPNMDDGCIEEIEAWIAAVPNPRLVVVDVFARVKGSKTGKETDYDFDYRQAAALQAIASQHNLAVLVIHHTRKMAADDPFDEVSGTRGLTGAADGVLVLKRDSGTQQPVLYGRGRDLEEVETAIQFDKDTGNWSVIGEAWLVADTHERREIQQVLGRSVDPMSPTEIGERIGKTRQNVQKMLTKMEDAGQVERISRGQYVLVSTVSNDASVDTKETKETTSYHAREDCNACGGVGCDWCKS